MSSNITLRIPKGSKLSYEEGDNNFRDILKLFRFTEDTPTATGTGDAVVVTSFNQPFSGLADNMFVGFRATANNTITTPTLNADGTGAVVIERGDGSPLQVDDIVAGIFYIARYNQPTNTYRLFGQGGGVDELVELEDVVITTPQDGEVLTYDAGTQTWINSSIPTLTVRGDPANGSDTVTDVTEILFPGVVDGYLTGPAFFKVEDGGGGVARVIMHDSTKYLPGGVYNMTGTGTQTVLNLHGGFIEGDSALNFLEVGAGFGCEIRIQATAGMPGLLQASDGFSHLDALAWFAGGTGTTVALQHNGVDKVVVNSLGITIDYALWPSADGTADQVLTTDGAGTLSWSTIQSDVQSVNGQTGVVVLDTDDISEGVSNLYFTSERVDDRVAALIQDGTGISWTYDDVGNTLTGNVNGLTVTEFASQNISQWTNDAGYVTAATSPVTSVNTLTGDVVLDYGNFAGTQNATLNNAIAWQGRTVGGVARNIGFISNLNETILGNNSLTTRILSSVVPQANYGGNTYDLITTEGGQTVNGNLTTTGVLSITAEGNPSLVQTRTSAAAVEHSLRNTAGGMDVTLSNTAGFSLQQTPPGGGFEKNWLSGLRDAQLSLYFNGAVMAQTTATGFSVEGTTLEVNNVSYTWPGANAVGALTNDGSGNLTWTSAGGQVDSVVAGDNISVDNTDPVNPVISATMHITGFSPAVPVDIPAAEAINFDTANFTLISSAGEAYVRLSNFVTQNQWLIQATPPNSGTVSRIFVPSGDLISWTDDGADARLSFFGSSPTVKPTVTGSIAPASDIANSLVDALVALGLVIDGRTP